MHMLRSLRKCKEQPRTRALLVLSRQLYAVLEWLHHVKKEKKKVYYTMLAAARFCVFHFSFLNVSTLLFWFMVMEM